MGVDGFDSSGFVPSRVAIHPPVETLWQRRSHQSYHPMKLTSEVTFGGHFYRISPSDRSLREIIALGRRQYVASIDRMLQKVRFMAVPPQVQVFWTAVAIHTGMGFSEGSSAIAAPTYSQHRIISACLGDSAVW